jgi:hypothetical protein
MSIPTNPKEHQLEVLEPLLHLRGWSRALIGTDQLFHETRAKIRGHLASRFNYISL